MSTPIALESKTSLFPFRMSPVIQYGLLLLIVIVVIKMAVFIWGYSHFDFQNNPADTWQSIWSRWDSGVYTTIAQEGYTPADFTPEQRAFLSHFPPMYPILIWVVNTLFLLPVREAAMLISLVAILAASYVLYLLVFRVYGSIRIAFLSALFLNLYPVSYYTQVPYAESLFLLLIIVSFWWLHTYPNAGYIAGITGALAVLTRLLGIAVIPAYLWFVWQKYRQTKTISFSDTCLIMLPLFAVEIYLMLNYYYYGDAFFFLQEYEVNINSNKTLGWPLQETGESLLILLQKIQERVWDSFFMTGRGYNALFTLFAVMMTIIGLFKRIPIIWTIFSISYLMLFTSFNTGISNARYGLAVFPMFVVLGSIRNKFVLALITLCFGILLFYFTRIYTSGAWTF